MTTTTQLSAKAQENLKRNAKLRDKDNKFIKLQPNEKHVLEFNPEKIEQVDAEFNGKKNESQFVSNMRFQVFCDLTYFSNVHWVGISSTI